MTQSFPTAEIKEGKARLIVPRLDESSEEPLQRQRSQAPVFYNPVQKMNRDTAVLVLKTLQRELGRELDVCEPMSGTGVRGIRFVLEVDNIRSMVMGDLSPSSIKMAEENAKLNNVSERIRIRLLDANLLMSLHCYPGGRFDYVDIDPYGSPSIFLDTGIRSVKNHGMIALTATDMAPLCGVNPKPCIRKYGGTPLKGEFCHETALRLMTGAIIRQAAIHETVATPVFSYYADHYIRLYAKLDRGAQKADHLLTQMGYIKYCPTCLHRETSTTNHQITCQCGEKMKIGGPLWLGELSERKYTEQMLRVDSEYISSRTMDLIEKVQGEQGFPVSFFDIDRICSLIRSKSQPTESVLTRIKNAGFSVTLTHFHDRGIKTTASINELKEILSE